MSYHICMSQLTEQEEEELEYLLETGVGVRALDSEEGQDFLKRVGREVEFAINYRMYSADGTGWWQGHSTCD